MTLRKTRNPANKISSTETIMFRGVTNADNEQMVNESYVENCNNLDSFRLREMELRVGQTLKETKTHGITAGVKTLSQMVIVAGWRVTTIPISTVVTPTEPISFIREITTPRFNSRIMTGTCMFSTDRSLLEDVTVNLRESLSGAIIKTTTTTAEGIFIFSGLENRYYYLEAVKTGYETYRQIKEASSGQTVYMCPALSVGEGAIVLTWEGSVSDLDLHVAGPYTPPMTERFHCYFQSAGGPRNVTASQTGTTVTLTSGSFRNADEDDNDTILFADNSFAVILEKLSDTTARVNISQEVSSQAAVINPPWNIPLQALLESNDWFDVYGPEVITLYKFNTGKYRVYVHMDDPASSSSTELRDAKAKLELYLYEKTTQTFTVPLNAGNLWTAIEIDGSTLAATSLGGMSYHADSNTIGE